MGGGMGGGMGGSMGGSKGGSIPSGKGYDKGGFDGGAKGCGKAGDWGKGGKGKGDNPRLQGLLKSWVGNNGYIQSPSLQCEVPFLFEHIPPVLQRHDEARYYLLGEGTKVLFTLFHSPDGSPQAKDVMPIPGPTDTIIGKVKNYGANSGYGFIKPVEDSPFTHDLYFNHKDFTLNGGDCMRMKLEGVICKFNMRLTPDGKGQAKNIQVVCWSEGHNDEDSAKPAGMTLHGIVQTYKINSGYGFITCPKLGRDVWFPRRELPADLVGKDLLGLHVEFDLWVQGDEKPQARNVQLLKGNSTEALRLDLMSSRTRGGSNMTVYDKVAIWQAHTGGPLPGAATGSSA